MENGLQNGLKCILRDIDFTKFSAELTPEIMGTSPISYSLPLAASAA